MGCFYPSAIAERIHKPFKATATPPTMMNLTLARASFANNFSCACIIVGWPRPRKLRHKAV